jgi:beta-lactamase class A
MFPLGKPYTSHIKTKKVILPIVIFVVGIIAGYGIAQTWETVMPIRNIREDSADYTFINSLLFVKVPESQAFPEYSSLKEDISAYVDDMISQKRASRLSVYFRNLEGSQWISVNPEEKFAPGSMLKVVTLITVLRVIEANPDLLTEKVVLKGEDGVLVGSQVRYATENPIRTGNAYTIETLLDHLITESDNVANAALIQFVGDERLKKTYKDLEVPYPEISLGDSYTTAQYSHIFRVLYNGTYLSREYSEKALELLSQTKFTEGIVAGVPVETLVSHKFGVKTILSDESTKDSRILSYRELHDCGIVYHPENPYFICIMTKGDDFDELQSVIKGVSELIWNYISEVQGKTE